MAENIEEKTALVKELCQKSLYFLCTEFLGYKDWDKVHDDLMLFLMKPAKKKALLLPRGHLKSSLVTIGFSIMKILENPNIRILIANQIWDMSRKFLSEIKGHLEASHLKELFGPFMSSKWNADEITIKQRTKPLKEGTITTTGVEAEQTGGHFDLIILDDLMGIQNSATVEQRDKAKRFRRSMINLLDPGGTLLEIGTRWSLDDTFSVILENEMKYYDVMIRKVVEDGKIIFPKHFSQRFDKRKKDWIHVPEENCLDYVEHLKASMPLDEYLAQYENNPISSENQLFKEEMFRYWQYLPDALNVVMCVDLAVSMASTADYTAISVVGMDSEWNLYVVDYLRGKWRPHEVVKAIFEMQSKWKPRTVGMEVNGFQRTYKMAVEEEMKMRGNYFSIEEVNNGPDKSKEARIKSLEPFYREGKVLHAGWMKGKEMEVELMQFPKGRHDDVIDSMCMALNFLRPAAATYVRIGAPPGSYEEMAQYADYYNQKIDFLRYL